MNGKDLFSFVPPPKYPDIPGRAPVDTSIEAADAVEGKAATLRGKCLEALGNGGKTADEVAATLGESVLTIRPRMTELKAMMKIKDSGVRRKNASGRKAAVMVRV